jgi:hypothetical protein
MVAVAVITRHTIFTTRRAVPAVGGRLAAIFGGAAGRL